MLPPAELQTAIYRKGGSEKSISKVIAIANQKGGVGKTTTAVNLGIGLVRLGKRVLLVDADLQGNLMLSIGQTELKFLKG